MFDFERNDETRIGYARGATVNKITREHNRNTSPNSKRDSSSIETAQNRCVYVVEVITEEAPVTLLRGLSNFSQN